MPISDEHLDAIIAAHATEQGQYKHGHIGRETVLALAHELRSARQTIRAYQDEKPHEGEVETP